MSFGSSSNPGFRGGGLAHRIRMWCRAFLLSCFLYLLILGCLVQQNTLPIWREVAWKFQIAKLFRGFTFQPGLRIQGKLYRASDMLRIEASYQMERAVLYRLNRLKWYPSPVFVLVLGGYFIAVRRRNSRSARREHIRGPVLISEKKLAREAGKERGLLPFGPVRLPFRFEGEHCMIAGKTQVGKTVTMTQQLAALREAGLPAVVYNFKGEYVQKFFRPGIDFLANPLDARGLSWNLFDDIRSIPDISMVLGSLVPPGNEVQQFWHSAVRDVMRGVIAGLYLRGKRTNAGIWGAISSGMKEIAGLCALTGQGAAGLKYIEKFEGKQASIVGAVTMMFCSWLEYAGGEGGFSVRKWIENPGGSFLFITGTPNVEHTLRPYTSLMVDLLCSEFLSLPDDPHRRLYFLLDEFGNMQQLPSVKRLLTAGGSKGATVLLGFQDFASIEQIYGLPDAKSILNSCGTSLVMKLADEASASYFSGRFGDTQYREITESRSQTQGSSKVTSTFSEVTRTEKLILPSEIQGLKKLEGYLMIPEREPAKIRVKIKPPNRLPAVNPSFVLRSGLSLGDIRANEKRIEETRQAMAEFPAPAAPQGKVEAPLGDREY
ncbi:MAG: hypothetical protein A2X80_01115 [Geobacteraceae bacterium GWB2_52_12]|nr:MAG: hypothetical protein A2X80_01115 [Geobacteraceae bacterium GWB2_52_12]